MTTYTRVTRLIVGTAGAVLMSIATAHAAAIQPGMWSGGGATLSTRPAETRIELGTGVAVIKGTLNPDSAGRFKASGLYEAYAPGPQRADQPPVQRAARITGRVTGTTITLTMHVEGERAPRAFTLVQGRAAKLIRPL